jgi:hypothetical protein
MPKQQIASILGPCPRGYTRYCLWVVSKMPELGHLLCMTWGDNNMWHERRAWTREHKDWGLQPGSAMGGDTRHRLLDGSLVVITAKRPPTLEEARQILGV